MSQLQSTLLRLIAMLALVLGIGHAAHAATTIYGIRGTATAGANDIIRLDPTTGALTVVYDNYPGGNAATIAQCPNGLIYYAIIWRRQSALRLQSANAHRSSRAAWPRPARRRAKNGVFARRCLVLPDRSRSTCASLIRPLALTRAPTSRLPGWALGGDMAFNSAGTLFGFNNTNNLFTIPLGGGAVTPIGTGPVSGLGTNAGIGLAFNDTDAIRVLTNGSPGFYSVNTGTNPPSATALVPPAGRGGHGRPGKHQRSESGSVDHEERERFERRLRCRNCSRLHDRRHQQQRICGVGHGHRHVPGRRQRGDMDLQLPAVAPPAWPPEPATSTRSRRWHRAEQLPTRSMRRSPLPRRSLTQRLSRCRSRS